MKKVTITVLLAIWVSGAFANNGKPESSESKIARLDIETVVTDKASGEALTGVAIYIDNKLKGYTDFDGKITLKNLEPGNYIISTSFVSYKKESKDVKIEKSGNIKLALEIL